MKRLGIIMLIGIFYLIAWAFRKDDSPQKEQKYDPFGLKYETCTVTEWNFVSMASKQIRNFNFKKFFLNRLNNFK